MRTLLLLGWLMVGVGLGAYHYGPGQDQIKLEEAASALKQAERLAQEQNWVDAVSAYSQALSHLPADRVADARRIRLERAKAQMLARQLPEAHDELDLLVEELQADAGAPKPLVTEALTAYANAQYYMTWLMRLEGMAREEWEPEIESARQTFRLLATQAEQSGEVSLASARVEDVESAIRLARMEPDELQGLAIPKQCQGCKSGQCKGKRPSQCKGGEKLKDARGASAGPPPDNEGS